MRRGGRGRCRPGPAAVGRSIPTAFGRRRSWGTAPAALLSIGAWAAWQGASRRCAPAREGISLTSTRGIVMRYSIVLTAVLMTLVLSACEQRKDTVVQPVPVPTPQKDAAPAPSKEIVPV